MARKRDTQPSHDSTFEPGHAPHESPEMWGWHAESGKYARIGGIIVAGLLLLLITTTDYEPSGTYALIAFALVIGIALVWDYRRRKSSWRR